MKAFHSTIYVNAKIFGKWTIVCQTNSQDVARMKAWIWERAGFEVSTGIPTN